VGQWYSNWLETSAFTGFPVRFRAGAYVYFGGLFLKVHSNRQKGWLGVGWIGDKSNMAKISLIYIFYWLHLTSFTKKPKGLYIN